jgi:hypothetical protein
MDKEEAKERLRQHLINKLGKCHKCRKNPKLPDKHLCYECQEKKIIPPARQKILDTHYAISDITRQARELGLSYGEYDAGLKNKKYFISVLKIRLDREINPERIKKIEERLKELNND